MEEARANVRDAFEAVAELYAEQGRALPPDVTSPTDDEVIRTEELVGSV